VITVTWGMYREGYGFGRISTRTDRLHLVAHEPWNRVTVCGVNLGERDPGEFAGGYLCPKCAKVMGIRSTADFKVDEEEARHLTTIKVREQP
jgi:hypothetical protein